eukprot:gb/GECG01008157.1/.p1 GENE.gb/GECG01008157.1/~~gb/GECG01008157.1/.p1  ORF type:complete len:114 (+),score=4.40 gb/GECG01008157.1/:1-342(+)
MGTPSSWSALGNHEFTMNGRLACFEIKPGYRRAWFCIRTLRKVAVQESLSNCSSSTELADFRLFTPVKYVSPTDFDETFCVCTLNSTRLDKCLIPSGLSWTKRLQPVEEARNH